MNFYSSIVRPLAFRLNAEVAHRISLGLAARAWPITRALGAIHPIADSRLETKVAGIHFANPVGLAAGFDKNGTAIRTLGSLGFGFVEIGSVSIDSSQGNPRPRLFRLPQDRAIVVHYGLPNDGAHAVAARLETARLSVPLGVNIVKTNRGLGTPPETREQIIDEYVRAARVFADRADYLTLNLSCPNTEDGRDFFADRGNFDSCLAALSEIEFRQPVFLKISPLGGIETIERVLATAEPYRFVSGFMFNLPPGKPPGLKTPERIWRNMPGAVSGPPAAALADACIRETYRRMDRKRYAIIGAGGVFSAEDAYAKIRLGASLVQLLTALVYEGPWVVRRINRDLARLLEQDGIKHLSQTVGADVG